METQHVVFQKKDRDLFISLRKNVNDYFETNQISQYGDSTMWFKVFFWLIGWAVTYLVLISGYFSGWALFGVAVLHMLTHVFIAFNIAHDANHGSISKNEKINQWLSYSLDLIGVSSYLWRINHNQEHHGFVNVHNIDPSIEGYGIIRLSPEDEKKPSFRFQHIYGLMLYGLVTFNYVTMKDFKILRKAKQLGISMSTSEVITMVFFKLFYWTYMLVLPMLLLDISFLQWLATFMFGHVVLGIILSLVFQCGHLTEEAHYPEVEEGKVRNSWVVHIIKTTGDFGVQNKFFTWLVGGINIHVIHHLFPTICHTHYAPVSRILKETVEDYGIQYRELPTFWDAIVSHVKLLKELGLDYADHHHPPHPEHQHI